MKITHSPLDGILIIEPRIFTDERGYFFEMYQQQRFHELGIPPFIQDNHSLSKANVVRGLHYQQPNAQGKLVGVTQGAVWDVVVDIRRSSPNYGKWFSIILNAENHRQMYIPPGFAHGFCVVSEIAAFYYKCTELYDPTAEQGIAWDDPFLNIDWPVKNPILSDKDLNHPLLNEIPHEKLFT